MRKIYATAGVLVIFLGGVLYVQSRVAAPAVVVSAHQVVVSLGDTKIAADIADTETLRAQGLSGRTNLDDAHGMLFVFERDGYPTFWMKDMLIPIDMLWLSADKRVVYIVPNAAPESYPSTFRTDAEARYVLEVPSGWAARHAVSIGSSAVF